MDAVMVLMFCNQWILRYDQTVQYINKLSESFYYELISCSAIFARYTTYSGFGISVSYVDIPRCEHIETNADMTRAWRWKLRCWPDVKWKRHEKYSHLYDTTFLLWLFVRSINYKYICGKHMYLHHFQLSKVINSGCFPVWIYTLCLTYND